MITVEYLSNVSETVNATMDFLTRRPFIKVMILATKSCCVIMCIAYLIKATTNALEIHDMLVLLFVLTWLFAYRTVNTIILRRILIKHKINYRQLKYYINKDKIWETNNNKQSMQQAWKQVKYIYKNQNGYLIPAIGTANAGKFIWLPTRGFTEVDAENKFLELLKQHKIVIKGEKS